MLVDRIKATVKKKEILCNHPGHAILVTLSCFLPHKRYACKLTSCFVILSLLTALCSRLGTDPEPRVILQRFNKFQLCRDEEEWF